MKNVFVHLEMYSTLLRQKAWNGLKPVKYNYIITKILKKLFFERE